MGGDNGFESHLAHMRNEQLTPEEKEERDRQEVEAIMLNAYYY